MGRLIGFVAALALLALWLSSAARNQQTVGPVQKTVQVQLTAVLKPTPRATSS